MEAKKYNGRTDFLRWQIRIKETRLGSYPLWSETANTPPPNNWKVDKMVGYKEWNERFPNSKTPEGIPSPAVEFVEVERLLGFGYTKQAAEAMAKKSLAIYG